MELHAGLWDRHALWVRTPSFKLAKKLVDFHKILC